MIKKSVHEADLIAGMQRELAAQDKTQGISNLAQAAEYLNAAIEIFEEAGMAAKADQVLAIMYKIAEDEHEAKNRPNKPKNPTTISDSHTKGLTPERMVENLKNHGIVFNMADDGAAADDLLDLDIDDKALEITDGASYQKDFEDEE